MNLKEAFRFQNTLRDLSNTAAGILAVPDNVTRVETTYLRKKAMPDAENETVVKAPPSPYAGQVNELVDFLFYLLDQRAALGKAIRGAKAKLELDMDLETGLNSQRQQIASALRVMDNLRAMEVLEPGGGTGYCFNAEGNQVLYHCDKKTVTTINFDRGKVRKLMGKLYKLSDETSARLDVALVTTPVDYRPPFDVNDSFESVFEQFCQGQS